MPQTLNELPSCMNDGESLCHHVIKKGVVFFQICWLIYWLSLKLFFTKCEILGGKSFGKALLAAVTVNALAT